MNIRDKLYKKEDKTIPKAINIDDSLFEKIKNASLDELKAVLNEVDSKNIFDYFRKEENG